MNTPISMPIVVELIGDTNEWYVSFNGPNPEEADAVDVKDAPSAFKLCRLVERLVNKPQPTAS